MRNGGLPVLVDAHFRFVFAFSMRKVFFMVEAAFAGALATMAA